MSMHGLRIDKFALPRCYHFMHSRGVACPALMRFGPLDSLRRPMQSTASRFGAHHAPSAGRCFLRQPRRLHTAVMAAAQAPPKPKKGKEREKDPSPYKDTVNLPQTKFNMRANSVQREPELHKFWEKNDVYKQLLETNTGDIYTLHDGPPYANGDTHLGHALNKILKSIIVQYQLLQGRRPKYVPGWDCHGLPIELKVLQSMKDEQRAGLSPIQLRRKARDFAIKTMKAQREQFKRYGIWGDWEEPYLTLQPEYEAAQLRVFGAMVAAGHIYRGLKPVHWSPSSQTALAEAELEYPEGHASRSIYVAMPLETTGDKVLPEHRSALESAAFAIWTTTGWTIPANLAIAINDRLKYAVVEAQGEAAEGLSHRRLVVAEDLIPALAEKFSVELSKLAVLSGAELEGCTYRHPLYDRSSPVVIGGDYITTESGTGLVHTAPGHGQDDYQVGMKYGLPLLSPVDDAGVFTAEAGQFEGLAVLTEGTAAVIEALRGCGALLREERYQHKYPYDWRTKQPTIFRATSQWFVSVEGFRSAALEAVKTARWIPVSGENRITNMIQGRTDWCISRQRAWGVPIPAFYYSENGEALMTQEVIEHVAGVVAAKGTDAWWQLPVEELLPEALRAEAPKLEKGTDTMDVWFDSGSSWAGVLQARPGLGFPADLYLEGSDQSRGYFQSSLLTAVAAGQGAPYRTVLTHGFALDEKGNKMSKSLGNVVDPRSIVLGGKDEKKEPAYGADVLRLWVSSVDYTGDVLLGPYILSQVADVYRKLRFTLRFILGNLHGYDPATHAVPYDQLPAVDRYTLSRLATLEAEVLAAYDAFQFFKVYQALQKFVVTDLSNFYLDVAKDRLYVQSGASPDRRACQTVLDALLRGLLPALAPILPHLAEDSWQFLPYAAPTQSIFQAGWPRCPAQWSEAASEDAAAFPPLLVIRDEVNQVLERARKDGILGAGLEARVLLHVAEPGLRAALTTLQSAQNGADPLRYAFIVSQVELLDTSEPAAAAPYNSSKELEGVGQVTIGVQRAAGQKCSRCWNYSELIGADSGHPTLCERCGPVIREMGFELPVAEAAVAAS